MSEPTPAIEATIDCLLPTSRINRRFGAPGKEYNTGVNAPRPVTIRNARLAGPFTLDGHGFALHTNATAISDWEGNYGPDGASAGEVGAPGPEIKPLGPH